MRRFLAIAAAALCCGAVTRAAEPAHVHGTARLAITVDAHQVSIRLVSPLDNIIGFEHTPRTDAERRAVDAALARLRAADRMFRIDPAAQCRLTQADLASGVLKLGKPSGKEGEDHADIDLDVEFDCVDAAKATSIDVGLFQFERLHRVEVQVALSRRAFRRDLQRPASRISLQE